jgi:hypothetical protein
MVPLVRLTRSCAPLRHAASSADVPEVLAHAIQIISSACATARGCPGTSCSRHPVDVGCKHPFRGLADDPNQYGVCTGYGADASRCHADGPVAEWTRWLFWL